MNAQPKNFCSLGLNNESDLTAPVTLPPCWFTADLRSHFVPEAPANAYAVAGGYAQSERWMLEVVVADMRRWRTNFIIAPMLQSVGVYRINADGRAK